MAEQQKRRKKVPGKSPDEERETIANPLDEPGTSDEIVMTGKINYADQSYPSWPREDASRQYIATPDEKQEIQHGVVTWMDAARSDKTSGDEIDRRHAPGHRRLTRKPPKYEL